MARKRSRLYLGLAAAAIVGAGLVYALWPAAIAVDMGTVKRGEMMLTVDEEGRTKVRDAYVLSTPIAGRLLRVEAEPGDHVVRNETIVAHMLPTNPDALDIRTREQAQASVTAASAGLRVARAEMNRAQADRDLALAKLDRMRKLVESNTVSQAALDQALGESRAAAANLGSATAAVSVRQAELRNARARLIDMDDKGPAGALSSEEAEQIPIRAPATGRVLKIHQRSETTLPAGAPIMEIGDIDEDLEIVAELLSTDAVKVSRGDPVLVVDWGGPQTLRGTVFRIDPLGFTKVSALGIEEQRVNAIIRFDDPGLASARMGHGYRVEVRIIVWQNDDAIVAPASALFREGEGWAAFAVEDGTARLRRLKVGRNNGLEAEILEGLEPGERIVLYPASTLGDGAKITERKTN